MLMLACKGLNQRLCLYYTIAARPSCSKPGQLCMYRTYVLPLQKSTIFKVDSFVNRHLSSNNDDIDNIKKNLYSLNKISIKLHITFI